MMATVHLLHGTNRQTPPTEPPDDMEPRIAKLEAVLPTLATKLDLVELRTAAREDLFGTKSELRGEIAGLRVEMHKEFTAQTWRIVGAMLTFGGLLSAAVFFIARHVK